MSEHVFIYHLVGRLVPRPRVETPALGWQDWSGSQVRLVWVSRQGGAPPSRPPARSTQSKSTEESNLTTSISVTDGRGCWLEGLRGSVTLGDVVGPIFCMNVGG